MPIESVIICKPVSKDAKVPVTIKEHEEVYSTFDGNCWLGLQWCACNS